MYPFLQHFTTKTPTVLTQRRRAASPFLPTSNQHAMMLQEAIVTIQDGFFDLEKSNFMARLSAASELSRLAYFISDKGKLSAIDQDLSNFRMAIEQQQQQEPQEQQDVATSLLPLLKNAIEKVHLALEKEGHAPDSISSDMMEETFMDLAAVFEQGGFDEEETVDAFIASHSSSIASVLKSSIAVLYERLDEYQEDMMVLDLTTNFPFRLADNPTAKVMLTPATAASTKEYTVMGDCPVTYDTEAIGGGMFKDIASKMGALGDDAATSCYVLFIVYAVAILIFPLIIPGLLYVSVVLCAALSPETKKMCIELVLNELFNPKCWLDRCQALE
jgi:hypothetical protein